jgi:Dolichyl-phosphate-mannose-protein mannosyltransferase/PA14 domain
MARGVVRLLAAMLLVGIGLVALRQVVEPPLGLKASYWASANTSGAFERSTDFPWLSDATRIDSGLDLRGEAFGVYFFNDASRFNFGTDVQPGRDQLPFSVRWDGWLLAPSDGARRFVKSSGPARVWVDEQELASADETLDVSAGLHQLRVEYTRPEARVPALSLKWQRIPGGELETVGGADVRWRRDAASPMPGAALEVLGWVLIATAGVVGIALAARRLLPRRTGAAAWQSEALHEETPGAGWGGALRTGSAEAWWRVGLPLFPLAFLVYGILVEAPLAGRVTILSGLDDWLIYESSARDILLNGLLMDGGQGHAAPFYGQPLYPYVLALMHRLTGESLFGPIVLQFAALGAVVAGTAVLARRAFGARVDGLAAAAMLLVLFQVEPEHFKIARQLFNENLYMPLVLASLTVLVSLARRRAPPTWWQALLSGGLLGLTAISRSQFLAFVPFALLVLWVAWRRGEGAVPGTEAEFAGKAAAGRPDGRSSSAGAMAPGAIGAEPAAMDPGNEVPMGATGNRPSHVGRVEAAAMRATADTAATVGPRDAVDMGPMGADATGMGGGGGASQTRVGSAADRRSGSAETTGAGGRPFERWQREARALGLALVVCLGVLLAVAPVTARNWVVSGQFVPISSSGGASLLEFHRPPPWLVDQDAIQRDALYNALHLDQQTRTVVAFARADPLGYLATWLPLGAHSVGLQGRNDPGIYWPLLLTVLAYAASFGLGRMRRLHVWPIHAFVGTHLLILMLFEADTYGFRLVMPMYAPMVAVAAQVPLEAVRRLVRSRAGGALRRGDQTRSGGVAAAGGALHSGDEARSVDVAGEGGPLGSGDPRRSENLAAGGALGSGDQVSAGFTAAGGGIGDGDQDGSAGLAAAGSGLGGGEQGRAARFAAAGWAAVAIAALVWQFGSLVPAWQDRDAALHGLGGAAAHAASTSDRVGADAIYVVSVDGTPRRFGAGNLPGLRYPWIKWFDPLRSLPLPPPGKTAVYMLSELRSQPSRPGDLTACLGTPDASAEVVIDADHVRQACAADVLAEAPLGATFDGVARIDAVLAPATAAAGESLDTRLVWQPLVPHPEAEQVSLQLDDPSAGDGTQWGNGTLELYPAQEWQPEESLVSRLPVVTDGTAIPQAYRLSVGMGPQRANASPAMATWEGERTDRVPVGSVVLTPGSSDAVLPADMRRLEGPPLTGGGLELIAARALPGSAAVGGPLRVGLLWRASQDAPPASQVRLRLLGSGGEVLQETALPLLGGRVPPSTLHAGNVVRDEQTLTVDPRVPAGQVSLEVALDEAVVRLGSLEATGRAHAIDNSGAKALASFGGAMELLSASVEPAAVHPGDKVTVRLRWRAAAQMQQAYKVFVHVLDSSGGKVLAQRDAEPQAGAAPTTSWVSGEALDDTYELTVPTGTAAGEYPAEVGVYEPKSGERLRVGDGQNRVVLGTRVRVQ